MLRSALRSRSPPLKLVVDRWLGPAAVALMAVACAEAIGGVIWFGWARAPGVDLEIYLAATRRLLAGGGWFLERQLDGPYDLAMGDILYPPVTSALFAPFLVLPRLLWWVFPISVTAALVIRWRPNAAALFGIALCVVWPYTIAKLITGNPAMWSMMFVALSMTFRWPSALVLLKPSLLPFALIGLRDWRWWAVSAGLASASIALAAESGRWFGVVINAEGGGPFYSIVDVPLLLIPVIAWLGSTISDPAPDERAVPSA